MKRVVYGFVFLIIGVIVLYGAIVIYGNIQFANANPYKVPDADKAAYSARIINTGLTFYSDDAIKQGKMLKMQGYWDLTDGKYRYLKTDLILDEDIFGPIRLTKRQ